MRKRQVGMTLWLISISLTVAWFTEALLRDRSFVSTYLAPVAIVSNILAVFVIKESQTTEDRS